MIISKSSAHVSTGTGHRPACAGRPAFFKRCRMSGVCRLLECRLFVQSKIANFSHFHRKNCRIQQQKRISRSTSAPRPGARLRRLEWISIVMLCLFWPQPVRPVRRSPSSVRLRMRQRVRRRVCACVCLHICKRLCASH